MQGEGKMFGAPKLGVIWDLCHHVPVFFRLVSPDEGLLEGQRQSFKIVVIKQ